MSNFKPDRSTSNHPALPLQRTHMPTDYRISLSEYTSGRVHRIPPNLGVKQKMDGFDPQYTNIIDYIVRITYRIWETPAREVSYIADCYSTDSKVFDDYGLQSGNQKIIDDTYHTTGAFPDIILDAEEVIWAGDCKIGFHTSHLTRILGTNSQASKYGKATGKKISVPVIANCVALGNDIFLEHVLYNTSAMIEQLGLDLWEEATRIAKDPFPGWPRSDDVWKNLRDSVSPQKALHLLEPTTGFDADQFSRELHHNIWNGDLSEVEAKYSTSFKFEGTTNRQFAGHNNYKSYVIEIRSTFPNLKHQIDEIYWMGNDSDGYLISSRWSAEGDHKGDKLYGTPSGAQCQIWGITQWRVKNGIVEQEWQLFNEFDVMIQIAAARIK